MGGSPIPAGSGAPSLDGPPPAPVAPGPSTTTPLVAGPAEADAAQAQDAAKQLVSLGGEVDRTLMSLAKLAKEGSAEFGQARKLIQTGIAKFLAANGKAPATSPTAIGEQFPGGGFSSIR